MNNTAFRDPTIEICGVPYPIKFGYRQYAIYGSRGNPQGNPTTAEALYEHYYSAIVAGCERNKIPALSKDEFLDALDDQQGLFQNIQEIEADEAKAKK